MIKAPIAVFAYNRCDHFRKMIDSLRACHGFAESPVTIFIDGPKSAKDLPKVQQVRDFVGSLNLPNVTSVIRDQNMGLKHSVYAGVSALCKEYGRVIALEDDLILSPVTLDYFNQALDKYADTPRLWSISAYQYDAPGLRKSKRALILPFTHTWGWATWERAWSQYDMDAPIDPDDLASSAFARFYDVDGIRDFRNMLSLALNGLVSCWFTPWHYKIFHEGGVSLFPPRSYIGNIGMEKGGTHASALNPYKYLVKPQLPFGELCSFPDKIKIDFWAIDAIRTCWDARVQKMISHLGRIKRLLCR